MEPAVHNSRFCKLGRFVVSEHNIVAAHEYLAYRQAAGGILDVYY